MGLLHPGVSLSIGSSKELAIALAGIFKKEQELFLVLLEKFKDKNIKIRGIEHLKNPGIQANFEILIARLASVDTDFNIAEMLRKCLEI